MLKIYGKRVGIFTTIVFLNFILFGAIALISKFISTGLALIVGIGSFTLFVFLLFRVLISANRNSSQSHNLQKRLEQEFEKFKKEVEQVIKEREKQYRELVEVLASLEEFMEKDFKLNEEIEQLMWKSKKLLKEKREEIELLQSSNFKNQE